MEEAIQRRVQEKLNSEEFETEVNERVEAKKKVLYEIMDAGLEKEYEYALRYERQKVVCCIMYSRPCIWTCSWFHLLKHPTSKCSS